MASTPTTTRSRPLAILAVVGVVVVAAVLALLRGGDDPRAVDIESAAGTQDADTTQPAGAEGATATAGTWTVDTTAEPYAFESSSGTFVGFRIDEELSSVGSTEAVGRTPTVTGSLVLEGTTVTDASFTGDITDLTTDRPRRDGRTRRALGVDDAPIISFVLTEPIELGELPTVGTPIRAAATGDLTVNGVTRPTTIDLDAALRADGLLVITSSFDVALSDHGVDAPSASIVLSVADVATAEVQLFLRRA